jgi:hypothetical protein
VDLISLCTGQVLDLTGSASPGVFHPSGNEENGYLHVITPMHVAR